MVSSSLESCWWHFTALTLTPCRIDAEIVNLSSGETMSDYPTTENELEAITEKLDVLKRRIEIAEILLNTGQYRLLNTALEDLYFTSQLIVEHCEEK